MASFSHDRGWRDDNGCCKTTAMKSQVLLYVGDLKEMGLANLKMCSLMLCNFNGFYRVIAVLYVKQNFSERNPSI